MKRRLPTTVLFVALVASIFLVDTPPASACSCGTSPFEPGAESGVELAFVGTATGARDDLFSGNKFWTFEVDQVLVGDAGPVINVRSDADGNTCGLETRVGADLAIIARRDGEVWTSGLCSSGPVEWAADFGTPHTPDQNIGPGPRYSSVEKAFGVGLLVLAGAVGAYAGVKAAASRAGKSS